jgi:hypothetical protein
MRIGVARRLATALAVAGLAAAAPAQGQSRVPLPNVTVDKSTQCVAPPEVMRRTHMDMLKHGRDRTVHQGIRGGDESLNQCISCHARPTGGAAIGSPDAFCQSCHDYVGIKLDCFECHQGRPADAGKASARRP